MKLAKGGNVNVSLELGPRIAVLDTVYSTAGGACSRDSYDGFVCRRATAKGRFIDYTDIDTMEVY